MSALLKILGVVAAIYVGVLLLLYFAQRSIIYFTNSTRPVPAEWGVPEMLPVTLRTEDGLSLLAWWAPPRSPSGAVLVFFHGNAGHLGYRGLKLRPYLDHGYGVLMPAWRGYSGNAGSPHEAGLYADGRAALRFLDERAIPNDRRVLYGESLGSGVAVELATGGAGRALVLEAPFSSLPDVAAAHYPIFPARWLVRDRFESLGKIGRVAASILIVHGGQDRIVPQRFGRALLAAAAEPKQGYFPERAGHNDLYAHGVASHVIRFVDDVLGKGPVKVLKK